MAGEIFVRPRGHVEDHLPRGPSCAFGGARAGRLGAGAHARFKRDLDRALASITIVELDPSVARAAGDVAERFRLRAYDAVHLASALVVDDGATAVVTWDRALAAAASQAGLDVAPREA